MSIGEVLERLRPEFPDTTISKLRFLEAEGLVEPRRTPAGYRKYSWDDLARLRFVLTAQRDHYMPLRVIREQLASREVAPTLAAVGPAVADPADVRLSRDELVARSGIAGELLAEVERLGLIAPTAGRYDADGLAVAEAVAGLASFGLEPRHLRAYRTSADREAGLFAQLVAPLARQNDPAAGARAADTARELVRLSQQLHAALVRIGLRDALGR
ncbi:transcriptional regulator FtsR [Phytohabitans rumicis]|nr:MerR family transcriptional regulator [Phytohabitans rumicis]